MNADNLYDVVASGELFKLSSYGSSWALRKFVLAGIHLTYHNKHGARKGQWDIIGCQVKYVTAEEVGSPVAAHAFALVGPKTTHVLCASTERNRFAWVTLIKEQIEEYKDPTRRFLRTGELVLGSGIIKKRGILGRTTRYLLVITNYPKLLLIDETATDVCDKLLWNRDQPPEYVRVTESQFKIIYGNKTLFLEDYGQGSYYWEKVFLRFAGTNMRYYVPTKQHVMKIDFSDTEGPDFYDEKARVKALNAMEHSGDEQDTPESRLKVLKEAMDNIDTLKTAVAKKMKILESQPTNDDTRRKMSEMKKLIAEITVMSNKLHHFIETDSKEKKNILYINEMIEKTNMFLYLFDDGETYDKLLRSIQDISTTTGTTTTKTATTAKSEKATESMRASLVGIEDDGEDNEEEYDDDDTTKHKEVMSTSVQNMDKLVQKMERQTYSVNKMILSVNSKAKYEDIEIPTYELITEENFNAHDTNKRPTDWYEIRLKRVLLNEFALTLEGVDEVKILSHRDLSIAEEEEKMVEEVLMYGHLVNMDILTLPLTALQASIAVTEENFSLQDSSQRPPAWPAVREKRVKLKESWTNIGPFLEPKYIQIFHNHNLMLEEELMCKEIAQNGQIFHFGGYEFDTLSAPTVKFDRSYDWNNPEDRPAGWMEIRTKRVLIHEHILRHKGMDEDTILYRRNALEAQEETEMIEEVLKYKKLLPLLTDKEIADMCSKDSVILPELQSKLPLSVDTEVQYLSNYSSASTPAAEDSYDSSYRPPGEEDPVRMMLASLMRESIMRSAPLKHVEHLEHSKLPAVNDRVLNEFERAYQSLQVKPLEPINEINFDARTPTQRPPHWEEIRTKRVLMKQYVQHLEGIPVDVINQQYDITVAQEEAAMIEEVTTHGRLLNMDVVVAPISLAEASVAAVDDNFSSTDTSKRPPAWQAVKLKRVFAKESAEIEERKSLAATTTISNNVTGSMDSNEEEEEIEDEVAIVKHAEKLIEEEKLMVEELLATGRVSQPDPRATITSPQKPLVSPKPLPTMTDHSIQGGSSSSGGSHHVYDLHTDFPNIDANEIVDMLEEAYQSIEVVQYEEVSEMNYDPSDPMKRPYLWNDIRTKRVLIREYVQHLEGVPDEVIFDKHHFAMTEEEARMMEEISNHGRLLNMDILTAPLTIVQASIVVTEDNYNATDMSKRPIGWQAIKLKRVLTKESNDTSTSGTTTAADVTTTIMDDASLITNHADKLRIEEQLMIQEVDKFGQLSHFGGYELNKIDSEDKIHVHGERTYNWEDPEDRPAGWLEIRTKRILVKENIKRKNGMKEIVILDTRPRLEVEEEAIMIAEMKAHGRLIPTITDMEITPLPPSILSPHSNNNPWSKLKKSAPNTLNSTSKVPPTASKITHPEVLSAEKEAEVTLHPLSISTQDMPTVPPVTTVSEAFSPVHISKPIPQPPPKFAKLPNVMTPVKNMTESSQINQVSQKSRTNVSAAPSKMTSNTAPTNQMLRNGLKKLNIAEPETYSFRMDLSSFNPDAPESTRPQGWVLLRMKRVLTKEQIDRNLGVDEDEILKLRPEKEKEEEKLMISEWKQTGTVVGMEKPIKQTSEVKKGDIIITNQNYDPKDWKKRPEGWTKLRQKRVMLQEHIDRINGEDELIILNQRPERELEEEIRMMDEVTTYNKVLSVGESPPSPVISTTTTNTTIPGISVNGSNFDPYNIHQRPKGWKDLVTQRVLVREQIDRFCGIPEADIAAYHAKREQEEDEKMCEEAALTQQVSQLLAPTLSNTTSTTATSSYGIANLSSSTTSTTTAKLTQVSESTSVVSQLNVDTANFDPHNIHARPAGWNALKMKRIQCKEEYDRFIGKSEEEINQARSKRLEQEDQLMTNEILKVKQLDDVDAESHNHTSSTTDGKKRTHYTSIEDIFAEGGHVDLNIDSTNRPQGWGQVKIKRVYMKEWQDRKLGVDEEEIMNRRYLREQEVEEEMIQEMSVLARIRKFENLAKKNKTEAFFPKVKYEMFVGKNNARVQVDTLSSESSKQSHVPPHTSGVPLPPSALKGYYVPPSTTGIIANTGKPKSLASSASTTTASAVPLPKFTAYSRAPASATTTQPTSASTSASTSTTASTVPLPKFTAYGTSSTYLKKSDGPPSVNTSTSSAIPVPPATAALAFINKAKSPLKPTRPAATTNPAPKKILPSATDKPVGLKLYQRPGMSGASLATYISKMNNENKKSDA